MKKWELKSKIHGLKTQVRALKIDLDRSISNPTQLKIDKETIAGQRDHISTLLRKQELKMQRVIEMIGEWENGCSCAKKTSPEECQECTKALIFCIKKTLVSD